MIPETESRPGATQSRTKHKNRPKTEIVPIVETLDRGRVGDGCRVENENGLELHGERESQLFGDVRDEILESSLLEVAFGETSFPGRSYSENLDILRKYSSPEQELGGTYFLVNGYCLRCICQCHIKEQVWSNSGQADADLSLHKLASSSPDKGSKMRSRRMKILMFLIQVHWPAPRILQMKHPTEVVQKLQRHLLKGKDQLIGMVMKKGTLQLNLPLMEIPELMKLRKLRILKRIVLPTEEASFGSAEVAI
ncbi:UNVERIFIED_CONTAM: hypothetical protein Sangu_0808500 [Sesamum angustifolium]|uniref:Uncharacterized protein n=1 Tax=Sesamum angustifolium TaxID=2727405 RepID=A0AAW2PVQ6_9LAMI